MIFSTRCAWRPPPNAVERNTRTISLLSSRLTKRSEFSVHDICRTNPWHFIGCHSHADARSANEDAVVGCPFGNIARNTKRIIGIVHAIIVLWTAIDHIMTFIDKERSQRNRAR